MKPNELPTKFHEKNYTQGKKKQKKKKTRHGFCHFIKNIFIDSKYTHSP